MAEYLIINPNNPIERDLWKDVPVTDENGNIVTDPQGRIVCKRYVVRGTVGCSEATVDSKISQAHNNLVDTTSNQTVGGNKLFTGTNTVPTITKTVDGQTVVDTDDDTTKIANTKFVQAVKAELETNISNIAEKSNAITVSDTAPNVSNMPIASGIMHPAQNVITENPDVSILALQQDLWGYKADRNYTINSFVIYLGNIYKCIQANGSTNPHAPTDSAYWDMIPLWSSIENRLFNTGDIKPVLSANIQDSWILGNGSIVNRSLIEDLTDYAIENDLIRDATEQAAYEADSATFAGRIFGPGDGSTTIQLPDFRGRSLMGAISSSVLGRYQPEQLPNVTGIFNASTRSLNYSGAFNGTTREHWMYDAGGGNMDDIIYYFNAHNSDAIYTDNGKVRPLSLCANYVIKC